MTTFSRHFGRKLEWSGPGYCIDVQTRVRIIRESPRHCWRMYYTPSSFGGYELEARDGPYDYFSNALWRIDQIHSICILVTGLIHTWQRQSKSGTVPA